MLTAPSEWHFHAQWCGVASWDLAKLETTGKTAAGQIEIDN
jgi:hypothetical protein